MAYQTPILIRTGRVQNNPTELGNKWSVNSDGFTKSLKKRIPANRLDMEIKGFSLNRYNPTSGKFNSVGWYQQPHIYLRELSITDNLNWDLVEHELYIDSVAADGYLFYDTIGELRTAALAAIVAATGKNCTYSIDESGDLVFAQNDLNTYSTTSVRIHGTVPWILGWGFFRGNDDKVLADFQKPEQEWTREKGIGAVVDNTQDFYYWETTETAITNGTSETIPAIEHFPYVRNVQRDDLVFACEFLWKPNAAGTEYPAASGLDWEILIQYSADFVKNQSQCKYFYEYDWEGCSTLIDNNWKIPLDPTNTDRRIHFTYDSNVSNLTTGYTVGLGQAGTLFYLTGEVTATGGTVGSDQYAGFDFEDTDATSFTDSIGRGTGDRIAPRSLFWAPGYQEKDPYRVTDGGLGLTGTPSNIFKTLLGVRSGALDGIAPRRRVTTAKNLFGADNNQDRQLIDWDMLDTLATASQVEAAYYKLDLTDPKLNLTILDALNAVLITLGIRMCYEYSEIQRARWITFRPFKGESVAQMSNLGKVIHEREIEREQPNSIVGGQYLYSSIEPEIMFTNGEKIPISTPLMVGRTDAPTFKYKDVITKIALTDSGDLPTGLRNSLYDYSNLFSTETFVQNISCTRGPAAALSVGSGCLYTCGYLLDRTTGARGVTNKPGDLISMSETLGGSGERLDLKVQINDKSRKAITPSLDIEADNCTLSGSDIQITGLVTDAANNTYQSPFLSLPDPAYFSCIMYNQGAGELQLKTCGCGDFRVSVSLIGTSALTDSGGSRNVWYGSYNQASLSEIAAGTATITLDDTTNFSTVLAAQKIANGSFAVDFIISTDSALVSCQTANYGWLGGMDSAVDLDGGSSVRGIEWG